MEVHPFEQLLLASLEKWFNSRLVPECQYRRRDEDGNWSCFYDSNARRCQRADLCPRLLAILNIEPREENGRKAGGDSSNVGSRNAVKPNSSVHSARPTIEKLSEGEG